MTTRLFTCDWSYVLFPHLTRLKRRFRRIYYRFTSWYDLGVG